jgi:hypothetical protein
LVFQSLVFPYGTAKNLTKLLRIKINEGHAVAQLVEALRYKPEGWGFDSRWCDWKFLLT